ncbi:MAG TPA: hypothetical protein VK466_02020, partial [Terriglobales bacterium]|nr:hypothetical protein [Terriglobales bacterium]
MTQVTAKALAKFILATVLWSAFLGTARPQSVSDSPPSPSINTPAHTPGPAEDLYLKLQSVGLDPARTYHIRDASLDHPSLH